MAETDDIPDVEDKDHGLPGEPEPLPGDDKDQDPGIDPEDDTEDEEDD